MPLRAAGRLFPSLSDSPLLSEQLSEVRRSPAIPPLPAGASPRVQSVRLSVLSAQTLKPDATIALPSANLPCRSTWQLLACESLVLKYVTKDKKGIEIGLWFAPVAPKREGCNCRSFDVFDEEMLRKKAEVSNSSMALIETGTFHKCAPRA